jgi:RNA polymerase sigma factor (sigma-70 family)
MSKRSPKASHPVQTWLKQYSKALHDYLFRRLRSRQDAEDMAQEVYLRLLRVQASELIQTPQAYLYGIASHVVHQFKIRAQRAIVDFDSDSMDALAESAARATPDDFTQEAELEQLLDRALNRLPVMQRVVLLLHKRDQLSEREIAQRLNVGVSTVKTHLARGQARMRTLWDLKGEDR